MANPPPRNSVIFDKSKIKEALENLEKEGKKVDDKVMREGSLAPRKGGILSPEERNIAMEIASRIMVRIRNGDLAKEANQAIAQQQNQVEEIMDEGPYAESSTEASDKE